MAKDTSGTEFLDEINEEQSASELWRRINCLTALTRDPASIADALANQFQKLVYFQGNLNISETRFAIPESCKRDFQILPDTAVHGQRFSLSHTIRELEFVVKKAKVKSAEPDGIGYLL